MNKPTTAPYLESKPHFHILDGLRGVAALAVVVFHFMEWIYYSDFSKNFIAHGFLAVDFFFCLSGFVMAYAYDSRLPQMTLKSFFTSRLIRLHPLVILGSVIGFIGLLTDPFENHAEGYSISKLLLILLCSLFLIPFPVMKERGFNLFSLNAPAWSLFWEYMANILYALVLIRLPKKVLRILLIPAAASLIWVGYSSGNLLGGWSGGTFLDGGIRMLYSFLAGLVVYRSSWIIKNKLGFIGISILLTLAFIMPWGNKSWISQTLVVLFYFPLLVSLGAGSVLTERFKKACMFLGNISYPLYMTHYVGIWWFGNYYVTESPSTEQLKYIIILGTLAMVFFSWLVMKFYDIPIRNYLNKKRRKKLN